MRVDALARSVETHGVQTSTRATIAMGAKFVRVFSSQIYTDKPLAIVGELLANAWDSHRLAGRQDVPIQLKLPTILDRKLIIYDSGVGMSHEFMMTRFNCFLDSTKDRENLSAGGFGIGSKTPAAYTDSYTIRCRQNGIARTYIEYKDNEGILTLAYVGEAPAPDEPDGVDVTIEIKEEDIPRFLNAAKFAVASFFDPHVEVHGTTWPGTPWLYKDTDFWLYAEQWFPETYRYDTVAIIGPRAYRLNLDSPGIECPSGLGSVEGLALLFDVGEVEIAPSREALSLSDQTLAAINAKLKRVAAGYISYLQTALATQPTFEDALRFARAHVYAYSIQRMLTRVQKDSMTWNGLALHDELHGLETTVTRLEKNWRGKILWNRSNSLSEPSLLWLSQSVQTLPPIIVIDRGTGWREPIREVMIQCDYKIVLLVNSVKDAQFLLRTVKLDESNFTLVSNLRLAQRRTIQSATVSAPVRQPVLAKVWVNNDWTDVIDVQAHMQNNPNVQFYATLLNRNKFFEQPEASLTVATFYPDLMSNIQIIGIPSSKKSLLRKLNLPPFESYVREKLRQLRRCPQYQATLEFIQHHRVIPFDINNCFPKLWCNRYLSAETRAQMQLVHQHFKIATANPRQGLLQYLEATEKLIGEPTPDLPCPSWVQAWDTLLLKFPMLDDLMQWAPYRSATVEMKKHLQLVARYLHSQEALHECIHSQ